MQMYDVSDVKRFVFAGNARFTIRSTKTGTRFTYHVRQSDDGRVFFVSLRSGSDMWTYMGVIRDDHFSATAKSAVTPTAESWKAFDWFYHQITRNDRLPSAMEFFHEGQCGRCGRPLTVPESILSGLGPVCAGLVE